jgi:hypothetical protein
MRITPRSIGIAALVLSAATVGIDGIVQQHPTTHSQQQIVKTTSQNRTTDFYLTQGEEQRFIYSESTRQHLGRGAMNFRYDGFDRDGRAMVYIDQKLLLLEMDKPTKFEYPSWENGGTLTLISLPSRDENGKSQIYVEVEGSHSIRKWP